MRLRGKDPVVLPDRCRIRQLPELLFPFPLRRRVLREESSRWRRRRGQEQQRDTSLSEEHPRRIIQLLRDGLSNKMCPLTRGPDACSRPATFRRSESWSTSLRTLSSTGPGGLPPRFSRNGADEARLVSAQLRAGSPATGPPAGDRLCFSRRPGGGTK